MRYLRLFLPLALLLGLLGFLAAGCGGGGGSNGSSNGSNGTVPADAAALVNGTPVPKADVQRLLDQAKVTYKSQKRTFPKPGSPEYLDLRNRALEFLVERVEFAQKAQQFGVKVTDKQVAARLKQIKQQYFGGSEKKYRQALKKQGLTDKQVREDIRAELVREGVFNHVTASIKVSDDEVRAYYNAHPEQYSTPQTRDVRHILVKKQALAATIYGQLCAATPCLHQRKGVDFAKLAKRYSIDPGSKLNGGKLTITKGQTVPQFDAAAFSLKTGETSKPVHTVYGYHVIQALSATKPRQVTPFPKVKETIRSMLVSQKKNTAIQGFLTSLQKEYKGKIHYAAGYGPPSTTPLPTTSATSSTAGTTTATTPTTTATTPTTTAGTTTTSPTTTGG